LNVLGKLAPDVAGLELGALPVIGVPVRAVGAGAAVGLPSLDRLETVGDLGVTLLLLGGFLVAEGHEQAPDEDENPPKPMAIELAELRQEPLLVHEMLAHAEWPKKS
jgi:hypothetical protein